jgi:hypothetical protein
VSALWRCVLVGYLALMAGLLLAMVGDAPAPRTEVFGLLELSKVFGLILAPRCSAGPLARSPQTMDSQVTGPVELAACPFCGGECYQQDGRVPQAGDITYTLCDGCGAITSFRPRAHGKEAEAAWNRRAPAAGLSGEEREALARMERGVGLRNNDSTLVCAALRRLATLNPKD